MNFIFKTEDLKRMIEHWLNTPPNGYIGVSYGRNPKELINRPMDDDTADLLLSWMREDIPVLKQLDDNDLSIVSEELNFETKQFYIQIGQIVIPIKTEYTEALEV
ncbi:hypothetical protein WCE14_08970 [Acinetobacter schindleri]|uniref:Uncharacterized protein n=1 Tax=Acinetobacter schindleri NIPH 900 TaxID=1217675 RepID=N8Y5Z2_9GAMM|nr:hypothetical protein [Acinetobacter schindleri]ENV14750.1 hypothetical protein F965_00096 [Acinetobacter schindleri NIPH 900]